MAYGPMIFCDSTFISGFRYDAEEESLIVRFRKDGAEIEYEPVPQSVYDAMAGNPRPGSYFRSNIYKGGYRWSHV